jgi:hypothetical protein
MPVVEPLGVSLRAYGTDVTVAFMENADRAHVRLLRLTPPSP